MRVHLVGLLHRDPVDDWEPCAYTGKVLRLARMLAGLGVEVVFYGGPDIDAPVERVCVVDEDDRREWFGDETWAERVFDDFDVSGRPWATFNARTGLALHQTLRPGDIIGLTMGLAQVSIRNEFCDRYVVAEVGVGYEGIIPETPHCFESEAWRHWLYGKTGITDGRWFDVVIPNAYDPADYLFRAEKDDYLLFLGRHIPRKGLEVVAALAKRHKVLTAGPGEPIEGVEHLGVVKGDAKAALLAGARAVLCPTLYVEPFGGVAVEAMLSGTPVLSSPFGAFSETVADGVSGRRCSTLVEFLEAADRLDEFDPKTVRDYALERYSLEVVAPRYGRWLERLTSLYRNGWYPDSPKTL